MVETVTVDAESGEVISVRPGPFIRTPYNYVMDDVSRETGLVCPEPTRAQQNMKDDCDINTIVKRFGLTGQLPENVRVPQSGDFTAVVDFHGAMNIVRQSEEAFMQMPADVRSRFSNDPGKFLQFVNDEKNYDEAVKLGIAVKREEPKPVEPMLVKVVPDPAPK